MRIVFISHATEDAQFAHRLADDLQRLGVQVWIAPESIRPGEGWVSAIERGLEESSHVVAVLTPAALESQWMKKEKEPIVILSHRVALLLGHRQQQFQKGKSPRVAWGFQVLARFRLG